MKCFCCGSHGFMVCQWPVEKLVLSNYGRLKVGDRVKRVSSASREARKAPATVEGIEVPADSTMPTSFTLVLASGRVKQIAAFRSWEVMVARPGVCGNGCCSRHRREVDDEKAYCADHWRAWEMVA